MLCRICKKCRFPRGFCKCKNPKFVSGWFLLEFPDGEFH